MQMPALSATLDELAADTTWLRRLARALVHDAATADDLVQDAYVVAAARAPGDGRPLRPWLVRVLVNLTRMRSRGARHRGAREHAVAELAAAPATPAELVGRLELHRLLAGLVLELSPAAREVVLLHYVEGLSSAAIGNRLGVAAGTVRWRLKQAIDELRDRLDHREPHRAWLPALAAFAGPRPATGVAVSWLVVAAIALVLGLAWIVVQVRAPAIARTASPTARPQRAAALAAQAMTPPSATPGGGLATAPPIGRVQRTVTGRVVDAQQQPVEGAAVTLDCQYGEGTEPLPATTSDARGGFTFEVDARCDAVLTAAKNGRLGIGDASPSPLVPPPVVVLAPTVPLPVHVVDAATGAPLEGAVVTTASRAALAFRHSVTTNRAGDARLALPAAPRIGPQRIAMFGGVVVRAPGYMPAVANADLAPDRTTLMLGTIRLARGIAVSGQLLGAATYPGATIDVVGPMADDGPVGDGVGWTRRKGHDAEPVDPDGHFELTVLVPGRYWLAPHTATLSAMIEAETIVEVPAGGRSDVAIHVGPKEASGLAGVVVDASGAPVAGATVTTPGGLAMKPLATDANGRFTIPMGAGPYRILARTAGFESEILPIHMHHGQLLHVTLQLLPSGIAGVVVDHDGHPVPGADVWRNGADPASGSGLGERATADAHGHFAFDVPRGTFVLSVRRSMDDDFDDTDDLSVVSGNHDVRLVVP